MARLSDRRDLTEGVIWRQLLVFFIPTALGGIFQQFYHVIDAVIVGKFLGTGALAAVGGSATNCWFLILGFFMALTGGSAIVISQYFGEKNEENASKASHTAITMCIIPGAITTVIGVIGAPTFMVWMKTPADIMVDTTAYLRIIFTGSLPVLVYNMGNATLRAVGDSRRPFIYLIIGAAINIVLDLLFVAVLGFGVPGAAWATVISQVIPTILVLIQLCKPGTTYRVEFKKLGLDRMMLPKILRIGVPTAIQGSTMGVTNMFLQVAVNTLGTATVAAWSITGKIDGFNWVLSNAAATSLMTFVGQNYGAGQLERIRKGTKVTLGGMMAISATLIGGILIFMKPFLSFFTDDPEVMRIGSLCLRWIEPFYFFWLFLDIFAAVLRGVGDSVSPTIINLIGICVVRLIFVFIIFPQYENIITVSISYPVSWLVTAAGMIIMYGKKRWEKRSFEMS